MRVSILALIELMHCVLDVTIFWFSKLIFFDTLQLTRQGCYLPPGPGVPSTKCPAFILASFHPSDRTADVPHPPVQALPHPPGIQGHLLQPRTFTSWSWTVPCQATWPPWWCSQGGGGVCSPAQGWLPVVFMVHCGILPVVSKPMRTT